MATDVSSIITQAQATAQALATSSASMVDNATRAFDTRYEISQRDIPVNFTEIDFVIGDVPQYGGAHFEAPAEVGAAPAALPVPTLVTDSDPTLSAVKPTLTLPSAPSELAQFNGAAPTLNSLYVPPAPSALSSFDITPPTLTDISVPAAPDVVLPTFDAVRPETGISAPGDIAGTFRADFSEHASGLRSDLDGAIDAYLDKINPRFREQMDAIETRLSKYLAGGTALAPAVEDAIFARAADKANAEFMRTRDTAYAEAARRGFTLPNGSVFSAVMQARQAAADSSARAANEIAIKQAELEQQNLQFAVTQSANLRQMVIGAAQQWAGNLVQLNAQALQFAQGVLQAMVDLYDIKVKIVQSQVSVYQAEAQVYEYRLKAVLAVYDAYQAHIRGLEAQVNVDTAKVQAFTAQANGYGALANAYRAVIDGVATKAQIEKIKVDVFGAEVQAYSAQVGGKTAEWQGYRAQIEGEMAKVGAYKAELEAYSTEVDAYKTKIQARSAEIQAVSATNESAARTYAASVQAYAALVQGQSSAVNAEINSFESTLKAYTAGVSAKEAQARVRLANTEATNRTLVAAYGMNTQTAIANAQMNYKRMSDVAGVAIAGAKVYEGMTSSALAGINSMAASIENQSL